MAATAIPNILRCFYATRIFALCFCFATLCGAAELRPAESGSVPARTRIQPAFIANTGYILDNAGNVRNDILYSAESQGVRVYFMRGGYSYVFQQSVRHQQADDHHSIDSVLVERIDVRFDNASKEHSVVASGLNEHGVRRYYTGNANGVEARSYNTLTYTNIYPGIDAVFTFLNGKLKTEYHIQPNGDYRNIRLLYDGMDILKCHNLSLRCQGKIGTVVDGEPYSYLRSTPQQRITTSYRIHNNAVTFRVAGNPVGKRFVLDPLQEWSTFMGANGIDQAAHVAVDKQRNVIVMGRSFSNRFPTKSGMQTFGGMSDAWVAKFSERGNLLWSTYYGGSEDEIIEADHCDIAIDSRNNIIFTGCTRSRNIPLAGNPFQNTFSGNTDTFIGKLSDAGTLVWSTYSGGLDNDDNFGVALDGSDNIYITGNTASVTIPTTTRATSLDRRNKRASNLAEDSDAFLFKLNSDGEPLWFQYIGGTMTDKGLGISTLRDGSIVITGFTKSGDFPVRNAIQQNKRLNDDAFVMRFDALGTIAWSTFLGGDLNESFRSVAFDSTSIQRPNIILTGITNSIDLPITGGYSGKAQNYDAIVASFTYDGGLIWYRLFGGTGNDEANGVAIDPDNNILLCGYTTTDDNGNFPLLGGFQPKYGGNPDGFLAKYGTGGDLQWSSYLGGDQIDNATDISVDGITNFVVVGYTSSKNFPVTAGSFQTVHGDGGTAYDGFITKVCNTAIPRAMFKDPQQPREYCKGGTTTLIATNTSSSVVYDSYLWKVRKDSTDIPVQNNTRPEFRVPPTLDSGEYKFVCLVTNSKNCPASSDTITVRINEAPTIITKPYKICKGESIQLDSVRIIGSGSYTYRWNNGKTLNDSTLRNPVSTPDTSTMYLLTVTDNKGCSNSQQLLVEVLEYPTPVITASGDTTFCIGGSVVLDAGAGFATYKWSNGAVTPTIIVSSSGVFTVDITTASGCSASSTPKRVTVHPLPSPSIIRTDDELETQRYARYQWVEGTTPVAGATNRQFVIPKPGIYSVQVTDSNGCKAQSLPFDAQIKGLASIRIGSDSASPGATVLIPVTLFSSSRLDMIQASQYKMWISWNASVLRLRGLSNTIQQTPVTITNGRAQTMLSGTRSGSSGVLTVMTFDVALGDEELSAITIDSVRWTTPSIVETTPINGTFLLTGLCKRLDTRLFRDNGTFGITMISPNPSSSESTVRFTVIEDAPTLLTLTDTEGREVSTVYSSQLAAGQYEVRFPTAAVAAGRYMIRLSSGNLLANAPLVIVR